MSAPAMKVSGLPEISTDGPDVLVVPEPDQQRLELHLHRVDELVDRLARQVERDDRDAVLDGRW